MNWLVFVYQIKYESTIELYKKKLGKLRENMECWRNGLAICTPRLLTLQGKNINKIMISIIWKRHAKSKCIFHLKYNVIFSLTKDIQIKLVHLYKSFLKLLISFDLAEELSDMRKQMKALEEKNVTYMKETMNLQEVHTTSLFKCTNKFSWIFLQ